MGYRSGGGFRHQVQKTRRHARRFIAEAKGKTREQQVAFDVTMEARSMSASAYDR